MVIKHGNGGVDGKASINRELSIACLFVFLYGTVKKYISIYIYVHNELSFKNIYNIYSSMCIYIYIHILEYMGVFLNVYIYSKKMQSVCCAWVD